MERFLNGFGPRVQLACYALLALGRGLPALFGAWESLIPSALSLMAVVALSLAVAVLGGIAAAPDRKTLKITMGVNALSAAAAFTQNADSLPIGLVTALTVPAYFYLAKRLGRVFVLRSVLGHGAAYLAFLLAEGLVLLLSKGGWVLISLSTSASSLLVILIILGSGAYHGVRYRLYLLPALTNGVVCFIFAPFGMHSLAFAATLAAIAAVSSMVAGWCARFILFWGKTKEAPPR